jgi:hypothetical protein
MEFKDFQESSDPDPGNPPSPPPRPKTRKSLSSDIPMFPTGDGDRSFAFLTVHFDHHLGLMIINASLSVSCLF